MLARSINMCLVIGKMSPVFSTTTRITLLTSQTRTHNRHTSTQYKYIHICSVNIECNHSFAHISLFVPEIPRPTAMRQLNWLEIFIVYIALHKTKSFGINVCLLFFFFVSFHCLFLTCFSSSSLFSVVSKQKSTIVYVE